MLTPSYARDTNDPALLWAMLHDWALREMSYREAHPNEVPKEARLHEMVPARDAGDVCHVCGERVTWTDHLPPVSAGEAVRCYRNVHYLNASQEVVVDDIFPRVD